MSYTKSVYSKIPKSRLRVTSSALVNIGSAFLLSPFTTRDPSVLTGSAIVAILCFRIAEDIEETLDNL